MSITESESNFNNLENLSTIELLQGINQEDQSVALAVQKAIPQIEKALETIVEKMKAGGRLFYIGAGTSGRLGILDASECPPTFGVGFDKVIGLIAGGDNAIRKAVEFAEDDTSQAWKDLQEYNISKKDFLIGIAASGRTPYVIGGLKIAQEKGIKTACITCNPNSEVVNVSNFPIEVPVGPEFVTGSTRMKAGTAQKMVLNMISTTAMIQLGHVKGNKMVDMQLSNDKLVDRGTKMIMNELMIAYEDAKKLLLKYGSVRKAVEAGKTN
ncbi:N-acetylmuramic acid 6-phosphate etherase [Marivirga sp.]|uniref:N-acetylmuramic acid 6-phosphate etherase n=1 Tax=Marivirga sp. TaxID=2018662 RepID=UPI002D7F962C|nr:N-acetylmuramic acid 6-phosphate etherase [Marivirga sp.]HET8861414.1 N-acetylmuramic acid 6-phosphate etherase [Marivirga sp.]